MSNCNVPSISKRISYLHHTVKLSAYYAYCYTRKTTNFDISRNRTAFTNDLLWHKTFDSHKLQRVCIYILSDMNINYGTYDGKTRQRLQTSKPRWNYCIKCTPVRPRQWCFQDFARLTYGRTRYFATLLRLLGVQNHNKLQKSSQRNENPSTKSLESTFNHQKCMYRSENDIKLPTTHEASVKTINYSSGYDATRPFLPQVPEHGKDLQPECHTS